MNLSLRRLGLAAILLTAGLGAAACANAPGPAIDIAPTPEISADDGLIEVGESVSPFDEHLPAIAKLDPDLRAAVQASAIDAEADGISMVVTSGWRTQRYQQKLLDDATYKYGSLEEARKHVNTPELSTHISGDAVDIGYTDADSWLSQHGARYGLCQIFANEMWHFELATEPGGVCPEQRENAAA
jgi:zinc D-Ala-D-Ala carboxypeptidase